MKWLIMGALSVLGIMAYLYWPYAVELWHKAVDKMWDKFYEWF